MWTSVFLAFCPLFSISIFFLGELFVYLPCCTLYLLRTVHTLCGLGPVGDTGIKTSREPTIIYCTCHNRLPGRCSCVCFTCKNMGLRTDALHGRTVCPWEMRGSATRLLPLTPFYSSLLLKGQGWMAALGVTPRVSVTIMLPFLMRPIQSSSLSLSLEHRMWDSYSPHQLPQPSLGWHSAAVCIRRLG